MAEHDRSEESGAEECPAEERSAQDAGVAEHRNERGPLEQPVVVTLDHVDWLLLRRQKLDLLARIGDDDPLMGLVHLLDDLQDQAAEVSGEEEVFGQPSED